MASCHWWKETGGSRRKGAGGVREVGEEWAGSEIPKVVRSRRKREKLCCALFCNQKNSNRREPINTGRGPGLTGTGSRRFKPPYSPPPPHWWVSILIVLESSCFLGGLIWSCSLSGLLLYCPPGVFLDCWFLRLRNLDWWYPSLLMLCSKPANHSWPLQWHIWWHITSRPHQLGVSEIALQALQPKSHYLNAGTSYQKYIQRK